MKKKNPNYCYKCGEKLMLFELARDNILGFNSDTGEPNVKFLLACPINNKKPGIFSFRGIDVWHGYRDGLHAYIEIANNPNENH